MTTYECFDKRCHVFIEPYNNKITKKRSRAKKAGIFIIDNTTHKVLLIQSFKTHLNNYGGLIYACDININSPALFFADDYFLCPRSNNPKFIE